jgi:hypothetical protein
MLRKLGNFEKIQQAERHKSLKYCSRVGFCTVRYFKKIKTAKQIQQWINILMYRRY